MPWQNAGMGLLDQLRADDSGSAQYQNKWQALPERLTEVLPVYRHRKIVLIRGEVILTGVVRASITPRCIYAVLHSERTALDPAGSKNFSHHDLLVPQERPAGKRPVAMGINRYPAESETNYYTDPWVGWVEPNPIALAAWIAEIIRGTTQDTPAMEERYRARNS